MGDQALAAVTVRGSVFWDVTPFSLAVTRQITRRHLPEAGDQALAAVTLEVVSSGM